MSIDVSIVVPVFNEADNILPLAREVALAMSSRHEGFELVFVDDASGDTTPERIREACSLDPRVRGLRHARNAGQSAALWTGICATASPILATLDGDLQNDPADLPAMIAELAHVDFVSGWRRDRRDSFMRRASSRVARWARQVVLKVDFADTGCAIRAFKREALGGVFPFDGLHRFLPLLVHGNGSTTLEVPVNHRPRRAGLSKYGVWNRLGRGFYDLLAMAWYQQRRMRLVKFVELSPSTTPRETISVGQAADGVKLPAAGSRVTRPS